MSITITPAHLREFTHWVELYATAAVDHYRVADAAADIVAAWPHLADVPPEGFMKAIITEMAATIDATPQDGKDKLRGILRAHHYRPRPAQGPWSPARDAVEGSPRSVTGEAYYTV